MSKRDTSARDREIAQALRAGQKHDALAAQYSLSLSSVYRAAERAGRLDNFAGPAAPTAVQANSSAMGAGPDGMGGPAFGPLNLTNGMLYEEMARTGLRRFYGRVDDDYDRVMRTVNKRVNLFREMGDDAVVAAVLQAIKLTLRKVRWQVTPVTNDPPDVEAAEFLESCIGDMAQGWTDVVDQALGCVQYGFSVGELVYKKRKGADGGPKSNYNDGRIGWRRWTFMAPESLAPGNEWIFDPYGGLAGVNQLPPPDYRYITLPIEKAILFRTSTEKNNPEGRSILRAMYPAWYYKKNLEEIEAISAERMGAGFPVFYLGSDVGKGGTNDDLSTIKDMARNVRVDEQMGLVLPWAKMGAGAEPGKGVLFELVSPPSRGAIDFNQTITRYEQRMAMVGLGQFIMLGMAKVGTQALAQSDIDFFTLAVSAWADSLEDTIHRYATERLFRINYFPNISKVPRITHETVGRLSLAQFADALNKLVGGKILTAGPELEEYVREYADLPAKPATVESEKPDDKLAPDTSKTLGDTSRPAAAGVEPAEHEQAEHELDDGNDIPMTTDAAAVADYRRNQKEQLPPMPTDDAAAVIAALREAVDMFRAPTLTAAAAPGVVIQSATMPLPDTFSFPTPPAQPAPVFNVTVPMDGIAAANAQMAAAIERMAAAIGTPANITVNVPEQAAPVVNFTAPAQPAPVVNFTPAPPIVQATVNMPEVEEEGSITNAKGETKTYKKTSRAKKG